MKAYRNYAGEVREIYVDVDPNGQPLLPPDTTIQPRPDALEGHYVTVVGTEWVQIEIPVQVESLETRRVRLLAQLSQFRAWLTEQPVGVAGRLFDADDQARSRLTQALVMHSTLDYMPPAWIAYDNQPVGLNTIDDLKGIVAAVQNAFAVRFFYCDEIRQRLMAATTEEQLQGIAVPAVPMHGEEVFDPATVVPPPPEEPEEKAPVEPETPPEEAPVEPPVEPETPPEEPQPDPTP